MRRSKFGVLFLFVISLLFVFIPFKEVKADAYDIKKQNETTNYFAWVYDEAGLFSQTEARTILDKAYEITENSDIFVITVSENPYGDSESASDKLCDWYCTQNSRSDNCVIFMIDMDTRYVLVYSSGNAQNDFDTDTCDEIANNVFDYAHDKDYDNCALEALQEIKDVYNNIAISRTMQPISNFFIAFVLGFVIMYLVALSKSKVRTTSDNEMLKYAVINFAANNPKDIVTGTTKTYCPRSSGSGGGRSGGGGGGHSHSSGGHRF